MNKIRKINKKLTECEKDRYNRKWAKDLNNFIKEDIQMATKHEKVLNFTNEDNAK